MDKKEAPCPVEKVARIFSDTWTMLIIRDLMKKPMRYNELHESLGTISTRTLALKLKNLEAIKRVKKKDMHYYALTPTGKKLDAILQVMSACGKDL